MVQSGSGTINLAKLDTGSRGDAMPVIMISTHAHRADIHLRGETPDEEPGNTRNSQGANVDNKFGDELQPAVRAALGRGRDRNVGVKALRALKTAGEDDDVAVGSGSVTRKKVKDGVVAAMRKTFERTWSEMKSRLRRGLEVQEVQYYNAVAQLRGGANRLEWTKHIKPAHDEVLERTDKTFKGVGLAK